MSKKTAALLLCLLLALPMTGALAEDASLTVTDMTGREITLAGPARRIIVTMPADLEILCALGCEDALVGRGEYCTSPESVLSVPAVKTGAEMNLEEIIALNPQVLVMTTMAQTVEQVEALEKAGIQVIVSDAKSIADVYAAIRMIGAVMGKDAEAEALVADIQGTFDDLAAKAEKNGKTVYIEVTELQWGPWAAGKGTFLDEIVTLCGLENIFSDVEGFAQVSAEQVLARNPDFIVTTAQYYGEGPTPVDEIMDRPGWEGVTAIRDHHVFSDDTNALNLAGPRIKDAALMLYRFFTDTQTAEEPAA